MQFEQCAIDRLSDAIIYKSYVGGSHAPSLEKLRRYIEGKRVVGTGTPFSFLFDWCGYARVTNVMFTEDRLLAVRETLWNTHETSNRYEMAGYVYVLRESRPMTTGTKLALGATVMGIAGILAMVVNEAVKPPPPPPAPPA